MPRELHIREINIRILNLFLIIVRKHGQKYQERSLIYVKVPCLSRSSMVSSFASSFRTRNLRDGFHNLYEFSLQMHRTGVFILDYCGKDIQNGKNPSEFCLF